MLARSFRKLTVEEFLREYEGSERKYELVDGEVYAMGGGSSGHADVALSIASALRRKLRGTGCRPFNSDMAIELASGNIRYPDIAIYCDRRDLDADRRKTLAFKYPKVVFEVLSESTWREDRGVKVSQYKDVGSVDTIVLVDPIAQRVEVHERRGESEWLHRLLPPEATLELRDPVVSLTHSEMFDEV